MSTSVTVPTAVCPPATPRTLPAYCSACALRYPSFGQSGTKGWVNGTREMTAYCCGDAKAATAVESRNVHSCGASTPVLHEAWYGAACAGTGTNMGTDRASAAP